MKIYIVNLLYYMFITKLNFLRSTFFPKFWICLSQCWGIKWLSCQLMLDCREGKQIMIDRHRHEHDTDTDTLSRVIIWKNGRTEYNHMYLLGQTYLQHKVLMLQGRNLVVCIHCCILCLMQKLKTKVVRKNLNPEWNNDLTLSISDTHTPVHLVCYFSFNTVFQIKI
jgi:hypothetical protein